MNAGSSTMFAELPALREPDTSSSRTSQGFSPRTTGTLWPESVKRWPHRVSADGSGALYELPPWAPPTDDSDGSVLPTPRTSDANGAGAHGDGGMDLRTAIQLLPTPTARYHKDGAPCLNVDSNALLGRVVWDLLPTPRAQNGEDRNNFCWVRPEDQPQNLENAIGRLIGDPMPPPSPGGNT